MLTRLAAALAQAALFLTLVPAVPQTVVNRTTTVNINAQIPGGVVYTYPGVVTKGGAVQSGTLKINGYLGNASLLTISPGGAVCLTARGWLVVGKTRQVIYLRTYCARPTAKPLLIAAAVYLGDPLTGAMTDVRLWTTGGQVPALGKTDFVSVTVR